MFFFFCILMVLFTYSSQLLARDKPQIEFGGALRFQYKYQDWDTHNKRQGGSLVYDMFRINADASYKNIMLHAEYRFYAKSFGGGMLKSGWMGYNLREKHFFKIGLFSCPFGLMPYQSNSFFFNINYYLGLEDDDDFGVGYSLTKSNWKLDAAFFKNADLYTGDGSEVSPDRYSYDVVGRNKESNTGVARLAFQKDNYEFGLSGLFGQLYNLDEQKNGNRWSYAIHAKLNFRNLEFKTQFTQYKMNPSGEKKELIQMGAFNSTYWIATSGMTYSACLSYTLSLQRKIVDEIKFYNDFSALNKNEASFNNSYQNDIGCQITAGPVIVYADLIFGKNHAWFGNDWDCAFAGGNSNKWNTRLNINFGYYF